MNSINKTKLIIGFFLCALVFVFFTAFNAATIAQAKDLGETDSQRCQKTRENGERARNYSVRRIKYYKPGYRIKIEYFGTPETINSQADVFSEMLRLVNEINNIFYGSENQNPEYKAEQNTNERQNINYVIIEDGQAIANVSAKPAKPPVKVLPLNTIDIKVKTTGGKVGGIKI